MAAPRGAPRYDSHFHLFRRAAGGRSRAFDGRNCTTHADCVEGLRRIAPLSQVFENRLFVEDGNRFSSAGISTGIDLMLHVVSRLTSPAVAARIAKTMVVYLRRSGSDPQISPGSPAATTSTPPFTGFRTV